jgi:predicted RNase H-like HicB family nuclease
MAAGRDRGDMVKRYAVVLERGETSWGAYVPDLPGCVAVAETRSEVEKLIRGAVAFHIEGLREAGDSIPEPKSLVTYVEAEDTAIA